MRLKLFAIILVIASVLLLGACENIAGGDGQMNDETILELQERLREFEEELRVFFDNNRDTMFEIERLLRYVDVSFIRYRNYNVTATDRNGNPVVLTQQLQQQVELYFNAIKGDNNAWISVREWFYEEVYPVIDFAFRLPGYIDKGIRYSPEFRHEHWEHLEGDWYIFTDFLE